jgi:hypothetical protein
LRGRVRTRRAYQLLLLVCCDVEGRDVEGPFMNKFRKLGFIEYNGDLKVHNSLLNVILHDAPGLRRETEDA